MPSNFRQARVSSLITEFASAFIRTKIGGGTFASVTKVDLSKDFREATVYLSVFPEEKEQEVVAKLKKELGELRTKLSDKGGLANAPHLEIKILKMDITPA